MSNEVLPEWKNETELLAAIIRFNHTGTIPTVEINGNLGTFELGTALFTALNANLEALRVQFPTVNFHELERDFSDARDTFNKLFNEANLTREDRIVGEGDE